MTIKNIEKTIYEILDEPFWPKDLEAMNAYERTHDDCDGDRSQLLTVMFSGDSDAWIKTNCPHYMSLRFRTPLGGGMSPRVRNALLILAMAIKKDNEDHPQE